MKKLLLILCLFSISAHAQNNLPPCNGDLWWGPCFGIREYSNGKYVGQFRDDHIHGQGTITYVNGNKYEGQWRDGQEHGQGTYTFANGNKVVGQWRNGKFLQAQTPPPVIEAWTLSIDNERKKLEEERRQLAEVRRNLEEEKRKLNTKPPVNHAQDIKRQRCINLGLAPNSADFQQCMK